MSAFGFEQGDIIKVESMRGPLVVVSKNSFNRSEQAICCPVVRMTSADPLHIPVKTSELEGFVMCEQVKMIDLRTRGYTKVSSLQFESLVDILDAIQGIFDYYPF